MQISYKFRLYPSKNQKNKLVWTIDKCRFTYNNLLEKLNNQKDINRNELQHSILKLKEENPELSNVYSKVLQYENHRLFSNLKTLSKLKKNSKKVGKLRFKSKNWFKTFTYNQSGFRIIITGKRFQKLHLSKIGDIRMRVHRSIKGNIKQIIIKRHPSDKWFAFIVAETEEKISKTQINEKVGIDLGILNYVCDSFGNYFNNQKYFDRNLHKLQKEQRRFSRKKEDSVNKIKQKLKVAKIYEKIVNQRNDFLHKLSRYYVNNYGFIAVENLRIKNMTRNHYLAKSIMDASWSKFIQMLEYKAESAGVQVIMVEPRNTTQTCSNCRRIIDKKLKTRTFKCFNCKLVMNRDYNSAINILKKAILLEQQKFTPMENEPLLNDQQV